MKRQSLLTLNCQFVNFISSNWKSQEGVVVRQLTNSSMNDIEYRPLWINLILSKGNKLHLC